MLKYTEIDTVKDLKKVLENFNDDDIVRVKQDKEVFYTEIITGEKVSTKQKVIVFCPSLNMKEK